MRRRGLTLGEIVKHANLPKTTIYGHICDIPLPVETKERLVRENTQRLIEIARKKKGKCVPGRIVIKPEGWNNELIFLVAHFMFDGEVRDSCCIYHNRSKVLINQTSSLMEKIFKLQPHNWLNRKTGVHRISYYHVELADYIKRRVKELKKHVKKAPLCEKTIFLKAFFDDEGSLHFNKRLVRGYQHNLLILKLIQQLLKDFDIESKIDEKYKEIVISRKPNLIKFRNIVNFSKGVRVNGRRKNSTWKQDLEKQEILETIIASYKPIGTPGVHR